MAKKTPPKKKAAKATKKKTAVKKKSTATHKATVKNGKVVVTPLFASKSTLVGEAQAWEHDDSIGATDEGDAILCERDTSGE